MRPLLQPTPFVACSETEPHGGSAQEEHGAEGMEKTDGALSGRTDGRRIRESGAEGSSREEEADGLTAPATLRGIDLGRPSNPMFREVTCRAVGADAVPAPCK